MSQPPGYEPQTPLPKRKTPGIAIASLVCGILSWVCAGPLAAIPAVITGHMALGRIKRSAGALGGRGLAIAGLILGYASIVVMTVLLVLIFTLVVPAIKEEASKTACMANLKMIGMACQMYAADHDGAFPERLSQLYEAGLVSSLDVFVCPSTGAKIGSPQEIDSKTSYEYRGASLDPRTLREPTPQVILACDKDGNHRGGKNILYADGHVESEGMGGGSGPHGMDWD
jgi:prepilin-type processing-associated H-X9-DG protein